VYRYALFAQGVRSVLARESGVQIVGMENDMARAMKAVRALQPEVILVEEPMHSEITWPFLEAAATSRIVTFSLHHAFATVYNHHRAAAADPSDLVKAIQGARAWDEPQESSSEPQGGTVSVADRHANGIDPVSQAQPFKGKKSKSQNPSRNAKMKRSVSVVEAKE
jgi:chemotaxis response regulator CheB